MSRAAAKHKRTTGQRVHDALWGTATTLLAIVLIVLTVAQPFAMLFAMTLGPLAVLFSVLLFSTARNPATGAPFTFRDQMLAMAAFFCLLFSAMALMSLPIRTEPSHLTPLATLAGAALLLWIVLALMRKWRSPKDKPELTPSQRLGYGTLALGFFMLPGYSIALAADLAGELHGGTVERAVVVMKRQTHGKGAADYLMLGVPDATVVGWRSRAAGEWQVGGDVYRTPVGGTVCIHRHDGNLGIGWSTVELCGRRA